jgi:hypothetical protein
MKKRLMFLMALAVAAIAPACSGDDNGDPAGPGEPTLYSITVDGGTASADEAEEGTEVTLTPDSPQPGYEFKGWKVLKGGVDIVDNKFTMLAADVEVEALFGEITYTLTLSKCTATPEGDLPEGTEVTLTPDAAQPGQRFKGWHVVNNSVEIIENKFRMPARDVEIAATYEISTYAITVTGGSANAAVAAENEEVTLTPAIPTGYTFLGWHVVSGGVEIVDNKFTMPGWAVEVRAEYEIMSYMLYWDGAKLAVGRWGEVSQNNLLFTKFGSTVAFTTVSNGDGWDAGDVKFSSVAGSYDDFASIPYSGGGAEEIDGYVSSDAYHTLDNVRAGLGDICKLVGLTASDIAGGTYDNDEYRLPTAAECLDFVAVPTNSSYSLYSNSNLAYWGAAPSGGGNGAWFPIPGNRAQVSGRTVRSTDPDGFLPAAGLRNNNGAPVNVGSGGNFWSSMTNKTVDSGNLINFNDAGLRIMVGGANGWGYAVRCVPQ